MVRASRVALLIVGVAVKSRYLTSSVRKQRPASSRDENAYKSDNVRRSMSSRKQRPEPVNTPRNNRPASPPTSARRKSLIRRTVPLSTAKMKQWQVPSEEKATTTRTTTSARKPQSGVHPVRRVELLRNMILQAAYARALVSESLARSTKAFDDWCSSVHESIQGSQRATANLMLVMQRQEMQKAADEVLASQGNAADDVARALTDMSIRHRELGSAVASATVQLPVANLTFRSEDDLLASMERCKATVERFEKEARVPNQAIGDIDANVADLKDTVARESKVLETARAQLVRLEALENEERSLRIQTLEPEGV